jgi:TonB family protein
MRTNRTFHRSALALAGWMLVSAPAVASAQDAFARAKGLYASADYDEALQLLESLKGRTPSTEVAAYQVFCLVALGRSQEARLAIESIVKNDPLFRPSEGQASPRVRGFFEDVRRPLLPGVVRQLYGKAKSAYDGKQWESALADFDRVISLADEISETDPGVVDLRTLALGFRDLTKAALAPPPPPPAPEPEPKPATPAPSTVTHVPAEPSVYTVDNVDVKKPVVLSQPMPAWRPGNPAEERMSFSGAVELLIDEQGKVLSTKLVESVHPRFDSALLEIAKSWTFKPATKNGTPVSYRYTVGVRLGK